MLSARTLVGLLEQCQFSEDYCVACMRTCKQDVPNAVMQAYIEIISLNGPLRRAVFCIGE